METLVLKAIPQKVSPPIQPDKKPTCFIHIGMHKTGSTAIQSSLDKSKMNNDYHFLKCIQNHSIALSLVFDDVRKSMMVRHNILTENAARLVGLWYKRSIDKEVKTHVAKNIIVSGEGLSVNHTPLFNFIEYIKTTHTPKIICYIRNPQDAVDSRFQERCKGPKGIALKNVYLLFMNPKKHLSPIEQILGRQNISYRYYHRDSLLENDIVTDFCTHIGLDPNDVEKTDANESLDIEKTALLYCLLNFSKYDPDIRSDVSRILKIRKDIMLRPSSGTKVRINPALFESRLSAEKRDFCWVEARLNRTNMTSGLSDVSDPSKYNIHQESDLVMIAIKYGAKIGLESKDTFNDPMLYIRTLMDELFLKYKVG